MVCSSCGNNSPRADYHSWPHSNRFLYSHHHMSFESVSTKWFIVKLSVSLDLNFFIYLLFSYDDKLEFSANSSGFPTYMSHQVFSCLFSLRCISTYQIFLCFLFHQWILLGATPTSGYHTTRYLLAQTTKKHPRSFSPRSQSSREPHSLKLEPQNRIGEINPKKDLSTVEKRTKSVIH